MLVARTIEEFLSQRASLLLKLKGKVPHDRLLPSVGFVPTMGYLHTGHLSLAKAARANNDLVVASIFVNPTQFAPTEDLAAYPRDFERDSNLLKDDVDILFAPAPELMYPPGTSSWVTVDVDNAESQARPGHFRGVATVLTKFFNIVQPDYAYFGQKDAMQCIVVQKMVRDLNFPTKIVVCPTAREPNGLAMSTRNMYLSPSEREEAGVIFISLVKAEKLFKDAKLVDELKKAVAEEIRSESLMELQYVSVANTLDGAEITGALSDHKEVLLSVAAFCNGAQRRTRLIDNSILKR